MDYTHYREFGSDFASGVYALFAISLVVFLAVLLAPFIIAVFLFKLAAEIRRAMRSQ